MSTFENKYCASLGCDGQPDDGEDHCAMCIAEINEMAEDEIDV